MNLPRGTLLLIAFAAALLVVSVSADAPPEAGTGKKHWAFQRIERPTPPTVSDASWSRNPIDRFIRAKLAAAGIEPVGETDRPNLIRRLYLDLIGLPPAPEEVRAFVLDQSSDAVARVVDGLLARPQYGERWGRHWLDLVRYAETNGYERDGAKPNAWRYRDYVIDAFNRDLPYDRFLIEQLAGDELDGSDAAAQIATTFLRLGTWDDEPADPKVDRYDQLDDVLGTAATAFLGITLRCARCHDHKFEPFSQADYYRMLAVFEPLKRPQEGRTELDRPVGTNAELAAYPRGDRTDERRVRRGLGKSRGVGPTRNRSGAWSVRTLERCQVESQAVVITARCGQGVSSPCGKALAGTARPRAAVCREAGVRGSGDRARRGQGRTQAARRAHRCHRGRPAPCPAPRLYLDGGRAETSRDPRAQARRPDPAGRGCPTGCAGRADRSPAGSSRPLTRTTGRRLWLAHWLTSPRNPLVARVIVNRVWQAHFGQGIVASASDLGVMGDAPLIPSCSTGWRRNLSHQAGDSSRCTA